MKILFTFAPQWMPISPYFAPATLLGQFRDTDFQAEALDINIDFYNHILKSKYVKKALEEGIQAYIDAKEKVKEFFVLNKPFEDYSLEEQIMISKASMIGEFRAKNQNKFDNCIAMIDKSVEIFKSKEYFYKPKLYLSAVNNIKLALEICSMKYFPSRLEFTSYINPLMKLNYDSIKHFVFNSETNMFYDYLKDVVKDIKEKNYDYIGVSINSDAQMIAGLTLAYLLKKETSAHVDIGGNHFTRVSDALANHPEFFELFCDSITVEEGEIPVYELARHVNGEIPIEEVPNLIYLKDGEVKYNKTTEPMKLNNMKSASLDGFDLSKYFTPSIVMPFQSSRGCYWRKCSFCDHDFGLHYNIKDVDKLIDEIKFFNTAYGIKNFEFIDEAISPTYLEEFSRKIIENNLDIRFFCDARLEDGFTHDVMKLAHKAGLRLVLWGFESGSKKIMDLINKGINVENRLKILKDSSDAGIYNFAFVFFGFPAETFKDAMQTIDVICNNTDIIHSYGKSIFTMGKHTKLRENPEKYGVVGKTKQLAEFSPTYEYEATGMSKGILKEAVNLCTKRAHKAYGNALSFYLMSREIIFLYLNKYGKEEVCNYKFKGE